MTTTPSGEGWTKGPYRVSRGAGGEPFSIESEARTIALVKTCGKNTDANARLIAAAPDLYAALAELLDGIDRWDAAVSKTIDTSKMPKWAGKDRARAALTLATQGAKAAGGGE